MVKTIVIAKGQQLLAEENNVNDLVSEIKAIN
jgi:hypothetical protein